MGKSTHIVLVAFLIVKNSWNCFMLFVVVGIIDGTEEFWKVPFAFSIGGGG